MNRKTTTVIISLIAALALVVTGCKKAADLTKIKGEALALVGKYGPQISSLLGKVGDLSGKAKALPVNIPGVSDALKALEGQSANVGKLKGLLDGYAGKVETAVKSGKKAEVEKTISGFSSEMDKGIADATTGLDGLTKTVGELEVKAKEAAAAAAATPATPSEVDIVLDGGVTLKGAATGVEKSLVDFIKDSAKAVDKTTWFNFDRLAFATGKAELDMGVSKAQLDNVVAIMKAFPNATLKIGGYTDNVGDAKANQKLSQQRAEAVMAALAAAGVDKKRLEAEGYGAEHPVCAANDTDECKAQNRRIAVRVSAK